MLSLITPPTEYPLTLEEVKEHLRRDDEDDDSKVEALLAAATARLDGRDGILGRCLVSQVWELRTDTFPGIDGAIELPLPPTIAVLSVKYLDAAGALQTLDPSAYTVHPGGWQASQIAPVTEWPATDNVRQAVRVQFSAGYLNDDSPPVTAVPENIRLAMLMLISDWYENRSNAIVGTTVTEMPIAVASLLAQHRVIPVA